jgi:hypothetical protein
MAGLKGKPMKKTNGLLRRPFDRRDFVSFIKFSGFRLPPEWH